ncbi:hypothetical protein MMC30_008085 [Trapelia coarctata]|nr:hypothetical protein [Trapelia coarctata]
MPKECRFFRTCLQMEYIRLLNFVDVTGIAEHEGKDLPENLKTNKLVLVAILTEIRVLMESFAELHGKYYQLRPDESPSAKQTALEVELVEEFASISLSYDYKKPERKHRLGTNHLIAIGRDMKAIAKNPRRLQWVAVGADAFKGLLTRLTVLNNYLQELLQGKQARDLEDVTRRSYLEMVQVRASVEELKFLVSAALLQDQGDNGLPAATSNARNNKLLASLASLKTLNVGDEKPPDYEAVVEHTELHLSTIQLDNEASSSQLPEAPARSYATHLTGLSEEQHVWIEWKSYRSERDRDLKRDVPIQEDVQRLQELVALLQREKPPEFCTPHCVGYFDDQEETKDDNEHDFRFGLVFQRPRGANVVSLAQLLQDMPPPSLADRVDLARKIVECILYLHAVNWLHKSLNSEHIILFSLDGIANLEDVKISGFEYARPDTEDAKTSSTTTGSEQLQRWEMYRHPQYQGIGHKGTYRKTFDIYSLGILLLEIAYWRPIGHIVGIADPEQATVQELKDIRQNLLTKPEHLQHLKVNVGTKYHDAVHACVTGRAALRIDDGEDELSPETGAKLQQEFFNNVVSSLEKISL